MITKLSKIDKTAQLVPWMWPYKMGYYTHMFYDVPRNKFYDEILKQCKDKICAEVGFGTGILSIIACSHGAKHVYAFERELPTYNLGKYMIDSYGLNDKITLVHGDPFYDPEMRDHYQSLGIEVTLHELLSRNLWGESLKELSIHGQGKILPERMTCNINYSSNPEAFLREKDAIGITGINAIDDILPNVINNLLNNEEYTSYDGVEKNPNTFTRDGVLGSYEFLIGQDTVPDIISIDIEIPEDDCVIWGEYFMDGFRLTNGHWRFDKVVRKKTKGKFTFKVSTLDGNWWIE